MGLCLYMKQILDLFSLFMNNFKTKFYVGQQHQVQTKWSFLRFCSVKLQRSGQVKIQEKYSWTGNGGDDSDQSRTHATAEN